MAWLAQIAGWGLVVVTLVDIYLTVLYGQGSGVLSRRLSRGAWRLLRWIALNTPVNRNRFLSHSGPVLLIVTVSTWVSLLLCGFALIAWPGLGTAIRASQGTTPTNFITALYYSGYSLTTLGTGDIVPRTDYYRLLIVVEAFLGFSVLTLTLTYLLSVYNALIRRNTFALSLHYRAADTADAAELVARLGPRGDFSNADQELAEMASSLLNLLQSHHSYFALRYFRFLQTYYSLPRIALVSLDTATIIRSALDEDRYAPLVRSAAVAELWGGGLQLLTQVGESLLPEGGPSAADKQEEDEDQWRERYYHAVARLREEGIATRPDLSAGADQYAALRRQWDAYVIAFARYLAYEWEEVAPVISSYQRA